MQHLLFFGLAYYVLLNIFKVSARPVAVDHVYTALFLATVLPVVYIHLYILLPRLRNKSLFKYVAPLVLLTGAMVWINTRLFDDWSVLLLPDFFFISYYRWWEITLFFVVFLAATTLLKLSKSWFVVNSLQRQLLESDKQRVQAELKALKAQVNPHFFFNTLNSIYSMSLDRDGRLPGTVLQLSEIMRYFLYHSKEDFVPLAKEIQVLNDYISLQEIRSDKELRVEKHVEGEISDQRIAPLLLISFVENAFKHGAKGSTGGAFVNVRLSVKGNSIYFRVENNKGMVDESAKEESSGIGLDNVRRRLELIYPQKHRLSIKNLNDTYIVDLLIEL